VIVLASKKGSILHRRSSLATSAARSSEVNPVDMRSSSSCKKGIGLEARSSSSPMVWRMVSRISVSDGRSVSR
jgi:hypothetical protein